MVLTLLPPPCVHKLYETTDSSRHLLLSEFSSPMETMPYPCSPLIPFLSTQHEESSFLLWSPQLVIPTEKGNLCDADADPSPDQRQDHELLDILVQETHVLLQDEPSPSSIDDPLATLDENLVGRENEGLVAVQEDLLEESSLGDILLAGAIAVEAQDSISASAILSRVIDFMPDIAYGSYDASISSSFEHLACYFARGLHSRLFGARTECRRTDAPAPESRLPACRMLQELSPLIKFAHFTANQAILEATVDDPGVHVVDLNVGEGLQWASLISDLARHGSKKPFHLMAVMTDGDADAGVHLNTARWLSEFAESLNLPFRYSSFHLRSEEDVHGLTSSCNGGSSVIVACDTTDRSYSSLIKLRMLLLSSVKILQPKLVVLTEEEPFRISRKPPPLGAASFAEFFCEALHHFAAVLDALAGCFCDSGYGMCLGLVEKEMLGPRIEEAVGLYEPLTGGAGTAELEGFRACEPSSFSVAQGKMLAGLFSRGFGVVHEDGRLALCWNSRPLVSISVWSPVGIEKI